MFLVISILINLGNIGIGHTRYSTTGTDSKQNAQPFRFLELMEK